MSSIDSSSGDHPEAAVEHAQPTMQGDDEQVAEGRKLITKLITFPLSRFRRVSSRNSNKRTSKCKWRPENLFERRGLSECEDCNQRIICSLFSYWMVLFNFFKGLVGAGFLGLPMAFSDARPLVR